MSTFEQFARIGGALWLVVAHAITARRLAVALTGRQPLVAAGAALLAVALTLAALDFHLLMLCRCFTPAGALTLATLQAAIAVRTTPRANGLARDLGRVATAIRRIGTLIAQSPHRGRIYFFAITSVLMAARTLAWWTKGPSPAARKIW